MAKEITYTVTRRLGVLSEKENGYSKQVNLVSWNGANPKLDIRDWSPDGKCLKGITLTEEEGRRLCRLLAALCQEPDSGA